MVSLLLFHALKAIGSHCQRRHIETPIHANTRQYTPIHTMNEYHQRYIAQQKKRNTQYPSLQITDSALLIIDMQTYFFHPDSPLNRYNEILSPGGRGYFYERVQSLVIPNISKLIAHFRTHTRPVLFSTMASKTPNGGDLPTHLRLMNERAKKTIGEPWIPHQKSEWAKIVAPLTPHDDDVIINKTTYSCFTSTGLDVMLRNMQVSALIIAGVVTNRCVETTARNATDMGYRTLMVDDATAGPSQEVQDNTLLSLMGTYACVQSTQEALEQLVPN